MADEVSGPPTLEGQLRPSRKNTNPAKVSNPGAQTESRDFEDSRPGKRQKLNPPQMTAAAAQAKAQQRSNQSPPSTQTSPNPASQARNTLMGTPQNEVSRASVSGSSDPANTMSAPIAVVAEHLQDPNNDEPALSGESQPQTSPVSVSSLGTLGSLMGPSGMTTTVGSPLAIEETARQASGTADAASTSPESGNKAESYPPPALLAAPSDMIRRGMSLPQSASRQGTRSPSSKKHRCPYCATEFTRHHNLKSHLLTHSQEKPYVCSTCQSRFRRLHDLKRHTKLHTGERPHICPKCGRKFARGDALARHNKGPGGCAGRRSSMGSFGDEDDYGDESMEGVMYGEPESIEDEEGNDTRPGIRRQAPSGDDNEDDPDHTSRIANTYPPIQGRPPGGIASGNFPPRGGFGPPGSGSSPSTNIQGPPLPFPQVGSGSGSSRYAAPGAFAQNPLTESPKPLSPGQSHRGSGVPEGSMGRNRSPSTHFQNPQSLSYPRSAGSGSSLGPPGSAAQLPPPPGLNPPDPRFTLASQGPTHPPTGPTGPPTHMGSGPLSSHSNSLASSHGQSGHGSGELTSPMFNKDERIWAYVKSLETRMNNMQQEIDSLRGQLATAQR